MIATVRESKARLSELVNRAVAGEDVIITIRGEPKARLVPIHSTRQHHDRSRWIAELRNLQRKTKRVPDAISSNQIIDDLRNDRI